MSTKHTITETNFNFPGQKHIYKGKVREVYTLENDLLVMISTDRLSAFDAFHPISKGEKTGIHT